MFNVGDIVRYKGPTGVIFRLRHRQYGIVRKACRWGVGIEFFTRMGGHSGSGYGREGYCWNFFTGVPDNVSAIEHLRLVVRGAPCP